MARKQNDEPEVEQGVLDPEFAICKLCKKPLVKTSAHFWACPDRDMSHRGLIHRSAVAKAGFNKKPHENFEV